MKKWDVQSEQPALIMPRLQENRAIITPLETRFRGTPESKLLPSFKPFNVSLASEAENRSKSTIHRKTIID